MLFTCSKEGCGKSDSAGPSTPSPSEFRLVIRRRRHVVRSVDVQTGAEKWNFSMGHNEVAAMLANEKDTIPPRPTTKEEEAAAVGYTFNVHRGLIVASQRDPYTRILWRRELEASLHKVWRLSKGSLRQLPVLNPGDPLTGALVPKGASCPHAKTSPLHTGAAASTAELAQRHYIYFGHYNGQLYVQMEDPASLAHAYPLPPSPSKTTAAAGIDGSGQLTVARQPAAFQQPPAGFYVAAAPGSSLEPRHNLAGLIAGESESLSVEAFGLAGNPTSWWFQSLVLGLFIFVVAHLVITRLLHQTLAAESARTGSLVELAAIGQSEAAAEKGELPLAGAPVREREQNVVVEAAPAPAPVPHTPNTPSSGIGPTLSSSLASSEGALERLPSSSTFESRYANEYTHVGCLGRGGFGVVFEARNDMDGCAYAIKRVCVRDSEENRDRLTREVKALARLDHPGIVRYFMAWIERPPAGEFIAKSLYAI